MFFVNNELQGLPLSLLQVQVVLAQPTATSLMVNPKQYHLKPQMVEKWITFYWIIAFE